MPADPWAAIDHKSAWSTVARRLNGARVNPAPHNHLTGLEFLSLLAREGYDIPLIMLTGYASIEHAVASIKAGAVDYIEKPVEPLVLQSKVAAFAELHAARMQLPRRCSSDHTRQRLWL